LSNTRFDVVDAPAFWSEDAARAVVQRAQSDSVALVDCGVLEQVEQVGALLHASPVFFLTAPDAASPLHEIIGFLRAEHATRGKPRAVLRESAIFAELRDTVAAAFRLSGLAPVASPPRTVSQSAKQVFAADRLRAADSGGPVDDWVGTYQEAVSALAQNPSDEAAYAQLDVAMGWARAQSAGRDADVAEIAALRRLVSRTQDSHAYLLDLVTDARARRQKEQEGSQSAPDDLSAAEKALEQSRAEQAETVAALEATKTRAGELRDRLERLKAEMISKARTADTNFGELSARLEASREREALHREIAERSAKTTAALRRELDASVVLASARAHVLRAVASLVPPAGAAQAAIESDRNLIQSSGVFDAAWYLVEAKKLGFEEPSDPVGHYLQIGVAAGLSPHPLFDGRWYTDQNSDVAASGEAGLVHYLVRGGREGRSPHPLFDAAWYLRNNTDVATASIDPLVHYLSSGWREGRSPSPHFSVSYYLSAHPDVARVGVEPLQHYLRWGWKENRTPASGFDPAWYAETYLPLGDVEPYTHFVSTGRELGFRPEPPVVQRNDQLDPDDPRPVLLFVAHIAGKRQFGAERSFLDLIETVDPSRYRVIAALPDPDQGYRDQVAAAADMVVDYQRVWWEDKRGLNENLVQRFQEIIQRNNVKLVYANTIMLRECLAAADRERVRSVCHVRELIDQDLALIDLIGLNATAIVEAVKPRSEYLVVNSDATRACFDKSGGTFRIYNAVDLDRFDIPAADPSGEFRVGLLSSNLPKKGVADLARLAKAAAEQDSRFKFVFFGPETDAIRALKDKLDAGQVPANLEFPGYAEAAEHAIATLHVVVNFSHFAESFGRTIAEAMAARRPVIVYRHGALPELVDDGETGFIIDHLKPEQALQPLLSLARDPALYKRMADAAGTAAERFSMATLSHKLNGALKVMLQGAPAPQDAAPPALPTETVSVIVPNFNYERHLEERLCSIFDQTRPPDEIIFLDDNSSDDSVALARQLLSDSDIPFKIIANTENKGVYAQWLRGLEEVRGDWIWIAEADDAAEPDFLESLLARTDDRTVLAYAQSSRVDEYGCITAPNNLGHTEALSKTRWTSDYCLPGSVEIAAALVQRNTIPNASAAIFRRNAAVGVEADLKRARACGDWLLYAHILRQGDVAFVRRSLNRFRRHAISATRTMGKQSAYLEEIMRVHSFISNHFRLTAGDIDRFESYLDRDYQIDGIPCNSSYEGSVSALASSRAKARKRRRIAFVTTNNGSWTGGSEVLWREAAERLALDGHDVIVVIRKWAPRPAFMDVLRAAGVSVLFKEEGGFEHLLSCNPDLVIVSTGDQDEGVEYFEALEEHGVPFGIVNQLTKDPRFWRLRDDRTDALARAYRAARLALFASKNNQALMEQRLGFAFNTGGVHFNPFHIDENNPPAMPPRETGLSLAVPSKLLFVHKGQDLLVPVFASEKWRGRPVTINFYGEGPDGPALKRIAEEAGVTRFRYRGRVSDIAEIWRDNHALLMPSRMEGLPIMLVSAMVSARVPILTDIGGHAEVVEDGQTGFIAANPDSGDLDAALERAWERRDEWELIGQRARERILQYLPGDPVGDFIQRVITAAEDLPDASESDLEMSTS
jgi:glycosyltransferase involved in cell wall biosynthesis